MSAPLPHNRAGFLNRLALRWSILFTGLFVISFSFPHAFLFNPGAYTHTFFEALAQWTGQHIFNLQQPYTIGLISDSTGFYLNAFNLFFIALFLALPWTFLQKNDAHEQKWHYWFLVGVRYYLCLQLLLYGFYKIFKAQFYLPEPNTLYTTVGQTHKDLLYWTVMGSSYTYSFFSGLIEVLAAILLLFKRTYILGALFTAGIMVNVIMINIGFDISVKLYSFFLLFLSFVLLAQKAGTIYAFFIGEKNVSLLTWSPSWQKTGKKWLYFSVKTVVVFTLLAETLTPYIKSGNYNDDQAARPLFHGAYQVKDQAINSDRQWKYFFIHRRGYFIVQYTNDEMMDYDLAYDTLNHQLVLTGFDSTEFILSYKIRQNNFFLEGILDQDTIRVKGEKQELDQLPLLQKEFGWTID